MWIFEWPLGWFGSGKKIFDRTGLVVRTEVRRPTAATTSSLSLAKSDYSLPISETNDRALIVTSLSKIPVAKTSTNRT